MNRIKLFMSLTLATVFAWSVSAQYDDLYYNPEDFYTPGEYTATSYDDYDEDSYDGESYEYDDYSYYTRRIRRFDRRSYAIDYYSSVYDPFYSPVSVAVVVGNPWRYNPWYRPSSRYYYNDYPRNYYNPWGWSQRGNFYRDRVVVNNYYNGWDRGWYRGGNYGGGGWSRGYNPCPPGAYGASRPNSRSYIRNNNSRGQYNGSRRTTATTSTRSRSIDRSAAKRTSTYDRSRSTTTSQARPATRTGRRYDSTRSTGKRSTNGSYRPSNNSRSSGSYSRGRTSNSSSRISRPSSSSRSSYSSGRSSSSSRSSATRSSSSSRSSSGTTRSGRRS